VELGWWKSSRPPSAVAEHRLLVLPALLRRTGCDAAQSGAMDRRTPTAASIPVGSFPAERPLNAGEWSQRDHCYHKGGNPRNARIHSVVELVAREL
jgi:hypothetical protein